MQYPRCNHTVITDNKRYIYILGSKFAAAANKVERIDTETQVCTELPSLITGGKNLSCCFFRSGMNEEAIYCLSKGSSI
jgi:hypothetical protein